MINQPNTLVTTEWLYPLLKEEFISLHSKLKLASAKDELLLIAAEYHDLFGVLKVANLSYFANLAHAIEAMVAAVADDLLPQIYAHKSLYASELLLHELTNYVQTGSYHQQLISNRHRYLCQVLESHDAVHKLNEVPITASKATTGVHDESDAIGDGQEDFIDFSKAPSSQNAEYDISLAYLKNYIELPEVSKAQALTENQRLILLKAWRSSLQRLLSVNRNNAKYLTRLQDVSRYMQNDAIANTATTNIDLWFLTGEWLSSLILNDKPTPAVYAHLLSNLDIVISDQAGRHPSYSTAVASNNLVEVYIQLRSLAKTTKSAQSVLTKIQDALEQDKEFFPRLLSQLEQVIFQVQNPKQIIAPLQDIKSQLSYRGWGRFHDKIDQILADLQIIADSPEADDAFAQIQWATERELQDLYAVMFTAYQTIDSKIGQQQPTYHHVPAAANDDASIVLTTTVDESYHDYGLDSLSPQAIRQVRIAVEEIKNAFNEFLHEHDSRLLDKPEEFATLKSAFNEMGLIEVEQVIERSEQVFASIIECQLTHITWELTDAIAEQLASLELFMDYLAQQTLDNMLLSSVQSCLIKAEQHLAALLDEPDILKKSLADLEDISDKSMNVTRYDDSGELAAKPEVYSEGDDDAVDEFTISTDNDISDYFSDGLYVEVLDTDDHDDNVTTQAAVESEELQAARAELKDDDFDMDEDIRDIFIEEAEEVLETLDTYLPEWQADPQNLEPLSEIRRGFHTLKGSGRMVGANNAGELAWAVENLLNRVLDGTLTVTDQLISYITETKDLIPILVEDFSKQQSPSIDPAITVLKAHNLQKGRPLNYGLVESDYSDFTTNEPTLKSAPATERQQKVDEGSTSTKDNEALQILQPFMNDVIIPEDADDADPDIKEIFIEEAQEVLQEVLPKYQEWRDALQDFEALTEVRRGFHTLKGSGRMVGANSSAELAWAIENMLNRVLDHSIKPTTGMQVLVGDVIDAYPTLVAAYEQGSDDYPEIMPLWIASAHAYSKRVGDEFDYELVKPRASARTAKGGQDKDGDGSDETLESERSDPSYQEGDSKPTAKPQSDSSNAVLESMTTANNKLQEATHAVAIGNRESENKEDQAFEKIFLDEAYELIEKIESFVEVHQDEEAVSVDDEIVRAFHTLRGAAGSRSLQAISEVSATVESNLEQLQQHDEPMTAYHLQAIGRSVALIKQYVEDFKAAESVSGDTVAQQDMSELQEMFTLSSDEEHTVVSLNVAEIISDDIDDLLDAQWELETQLSVNDDAEVELYAEVLAAQCQALLARVSHSTKFVTLVSSLEAVYAHIRQTPQAAQDDVVIDALLAGQAQLTGLLDSLAGSMTLKLDDDVITQLNAIAQPAYSSTTTASTTTKPKIAPIEIEEIATDAELLEIFLEEAQEIDVDIINSFAAWQANPSDMAALKVLQRHLHTIKGGARMAGIASIGDLTHEAETIYQHFVEGKTEPDETWVAVMQSVQDTLSQQIDYVINEGKSFYATGLVNQLRTLADNKEIPADFKLDLPIVTATADEEESPEQLIEELELDAPETEITDTEFEQFKLSTWDGNEPDADILEVFLEEAEELVDSSAANMQAFRSNTSNIAALQELQRELHTMKGGARMVSANGIADIAHHMETVYEDLASRRRPATKMVSQLLALCHDWMVEAIYLLKHGINAPEPTELIDELKHFSASPDDLERLPKVSLQEYVDVIRKYEAWKNARFGLQDISEMPPSSIGSADTEEYANLSNEMIRVSSGLMEQMINLSGESAINRARIDMSMTSLNNTIDEMGMTVQRLADQLRRMDIELEAQILSQIDDESKLDEGFDPLEMDQYSSLNQLSKSLSESASDLLDIKTTMLDKTRDAEDLLLQLSRTQAELQDGLMNSRMVPFARLTPRLQRIVRQTANELNKSVELKIINADDEMDRTILERITSPLEHMLRNAVDHGIETPSEREAQGKPRAGHVVLEVTREGSEVVIKLSDDGRGINVDAVRKKAISQGLIDENDTSLTDLDIMQYIFNAGLTTTSKVTQISGRGVGMDVVLSEIRQLGGTVSVESEAGKGSVFAMRVPLTVAISDALVVRVADRYYAIPLIQIERVERVNPEALFEYYQSNSNTFDINGTDYRLRYLNEMLSGVTLNEMAVNMNVSLPVIIVKNQTGQNLAIQVDEVAGSRIEVVVKPLGRQLSHISGLSAATIMGDGSVMLILDILALIRNAPARSIHKAKVKKEQGAKQARPKILVVDDSVTVRKVTTRLLERQGYDAYVARDGVDALEILQELKPDLMLLDIEMPRMDGFDVAQNVRHDNRLKDLPIIMITSRTGDKHRERAMEIGVNEYMGKPFQEAQLISTIQSVIGVIEGDNYD